MSARCLVLTPLFDLLLAGPAFAQEEEPVDPEPDRKNITVSFPAVSHMDLDGAVVDAPVVRPTIGLIDLRKRADFAPMIHLRADFDDQLDGSVDEVR